MVKLLYRDRKWLFRKYVSEKKSIDSISKESGINRSTITKWIYRLKIPTRNLSQSHKGLKPPNYKGWHWNNGYIEVYIKGKKFLQHRIVMERAIGRKLRKGEVVHHLNEKPTDNRIENLEVYSSPGRHTFYGHHHYPNPPK